MMKPESKISFFIFNFLIFSSNCIFLYFLEKEHPISAGIIFPSALVGIAISAIFQRLRFGREEGWRIRYAPSVFLAFNLGFDLVFVPMALFGPHGG
jgi:hypothetical protein